MSRFSFVILTAFTMFISAPGAYASTWDISAIEIRELPEEAPVQLLIDSDCSTHSPFELPQLGPGDLDFGQIISIGEKIWKIIEANKPVVTVTTPVVSALPRGLTCWSDLDGWKAPKVKSYEVLYKNYMGFEVVKFRFRVQFTYGGGREGLGKYLANVTVLPGELNVLWGYKFDAKVEAQPAVNLGTKADPMAGMELNLLWTIKTPVKESQNSFHFFVQGDGTLQADN